MIFQPRRIAPLLGLIGVAALLLSCGGAEPPISTLTRPDETAGASAGSPTGAPSNAPRSGQPVAAAVDRVLAISVDGLSPELLRAGGRATDTFHELAGLGAATFEGRTEVESTRTLPNHAGMVTGRRVDVAGGGHGVTFNEDDGNTVVRAAGASVGSLFDVVAGAGLQTTMVASKSKFALFERSWPVSLARSVYCRTAEEVLEEALDALDAAPGVVFAHIAGPDEAGHAHGFASRSYRAAVARVDRALTSVVERVRDSDEEPIGLVVTADHGGDEEGHGQVDDPDHFTVPFVVVAPGIDPGLDLADLVGARTPVGRQVPLSGRQPVRNADLANAVTALLGLGAVPESEFHLVGDALAR